MMLAEAGSRARGLTSVATRLSAAFVSAAGAAIGSCLEGERPVRERY